MEIVKKIKIRRNELEFRLIKRKILSKKDSNGIRRIEEKMTILHLSNVIEELPEGEIFIPFTIIYSKNTSNIINNSELNPAIVVKNILKPTTIIGAYDNDFIFEMIVKNDNITIKYLIDDSAKNRIILRNKYKSQSE